METHDDVTPVARMARNVASIADIPWEQLPDGAARGCLLDMAYVGGDVFAYRSPGGEWFIHLQRQVLTCAEWAARFCI